MRNLILILCFFISVNVISQSRTAYVLIKEKKGGFSCPNQQTDFRIHFLNSKLDYQRRQKVLEVFKNRLISGLDKKQYRVRVRTVLMDQSDYLAIYQYDYRYAEKKDPKCTTNIANTIKAFAVSKFEEANKKLDKIEKGAWFPERSSNYKIIEVKQPFKSDESYLEVMRKFLNIKYINESKKKKNTSKSTAIGVRG